MTGATTPWILITRPAEDALTLAAEIKTWGADPIIAPVMRVVPLMSTETSLEDVQALVFTSANGVRAFVAHQTERDLPVFAVGTATASCARSAGFTAIATAEGSVSDLARLIAERSDPNNGSLLHVSGSVIARDLGELLRGRGFSVRRAVLYRTDCCDDLPLAAWQVLQSGRRGAILVYSPRSLTCLTAILTAHAHQAENISWRDISLICLSRYIVDSVTLPCEVVCADQPHPAAMESMIKRWMEYRHDDA